MNRRSFLKLLSAAGPVAAVAPCLLRASVDAEAKFPTFEEIQPRLMEALEKNSPLPFIEQMLSDYDAASCIARYLLPRKLSA